MFFGSHLPSPSYYAGNASAGVIKNYSLKLLLAMLNVYCHYCDVMQVDVPGGVPKKTIIGTPKENCREQRTCRDL
jgi:hypothetical protein